VGLLPGEGSLLITPKLVNVPQGGRQSFVATDEQAYGDAADVTWSLSGNTSASTMIDPVSGTLFVGNDETASTLLVTATLTDGSNRFVSAVVTVTAVTDFLLGDVNGNGAVNMQDVMLIYQHYRGKIVLTAEQRLAADVNGNGAVNMQDVMLVYQYYRGKIASFQ
jgi:hypothetical protein